MNQDKYTRRALMSRVGGAVAVSALTPFVPLLNADAQAATGDIIRYVPWYTPVFPSSDIVKNWMPNSQGDNLRFRGSFTSLNAMADKMSLLRGLGNKAGYVTGRDGYKMAGGHKPSGLTMLTGRELNTGRTGTKLEGGFSLGNHSSLEVWMGDKMIENNDGVKRPYFLTGYKNGSGFNNDEVWKSCSFRNGTFLQRHQSPKSLYEEMVRFAPSGGSTAPANDGQRSAYAAVAEELKRIRRQLGSEDSARLDQHLEEINNLEQSLAEQPATGGRSCDLPESFENPMNQHDKYMNEYIKLIRIAFTCNVTRVIGHMDFGHLFTGGLNFLPNGNGNYHGATHDGGTANNRFIESVAKYRADTYVKLLQELQSVTEPGGKTLLDNSIVHWYSEVSRNHDWHDQFNVIGGGGGHFKMGLCQVLGAPNHNPSSEGSANKNTSISNYTQNRLLVSIANAMGFNITEFGNPDYNNGPLPSSVLI